jgi:hypothetical protein
MEAVTLCRNPYIPESHDNICLSSQYLGSGEREGWSVPGQLR